MQRSAPVGRAFRDNAFRASSRLECVRLTTVSSFAIEPPPAEGIIDKAKTIGTSPTSLRGPTEERQFPAKAIR